MAVLMAAVSPHERPRERLLARGAEALSERELLAVLLRSCVAARKGSAPSISPLSSWRSTAAYMGWLRLIPRNSRPDGVSVQRRRRRWSLRSNSLAALVAGSMS